jgi:hypothetical protein
VNEKMERMKAMAGKKRSDRENNYFVEQGVLARP